MDKLNNLVNCRPAIFADKKVYEKITMRVRQKIAAVFLAAAAAAGFAGCFGGQGNSRQDVFSGIASAETYRDIPGVTETEILAIEALKSSRQYFSFGVNSSTEAFVLPNGLYAGFSDNFCELLSGLFGIPFVMEFNTWNRTVEALNSGDIDFTSALIPTPERRRIYSMSHTIAERALAAFTYGPSPRIETESDLNGLRVGVIAEAVIPQAIFSAYPNLAFETVSVRDGQEALQMLASGRIDVLINFAADAYFFANSASVSSAAILPFVYCPVSLVAKKTELAPVISVMNKYIEAGGASRLRELYEEGSREYSRHVFLQSLTGEETVWLEALHITGAKIPVALEHDNYPASFYNEEERQFQGIAVDILDEISELTGIKFYEAAGRYASWTEIFQKLTAGEVALVSELLFSEDRKDNYLWSESYASSHYALLSKTSYPYLKAYQVIQASVGVGKDTAYEEMFGALFPGHPNVRYYDSQSELFDALEKGEIDLMAASENVLLMLRNYREKTGYKVNVKLYAPLDESHFGFNKNAEPLRTIFCKAQRGINSAAIVEDWTSRIYDYSRRIAHERMVYSIVLAALVLAALAIVLVLHARNYRLRERYKNQVATLSAVYDSLPDFVYSKNPENQYTSCNKNFAEFVGFTDEKDVIGKTLRDVYPGHENTAKRIDATDYKVFNDVIALKYNEWYTFPDKSRRLYEVTKTPLFLEGKPAGVLGIDRDITEHYNAVLRANSAVRAKDDFLAKMSHEIRTPMNAIIGMTELVLRSNDLAAARTHLTTIKQAGSHLLSIINDILDFSKIREGKFEITDREYLFSSLINDVISIIRMRLIDSRVRFAVFVESAIPNALTGDETRIRQVLLNLLSNAVKYTEQGFVSLKVFANGTEKDTVNFVLEVMDSGKGIKEEDVALLFKDYVQVDTERNRNVEGAGLGLAISYSIIKLMGGDISVKSEYNRGSTFTVTLPQKKRSDEPLASVENPREKNVLVYERREIYADSLVRTLDDLGVSCTLVAKESELYERLAAETYSFVFVPIVILKNRQDELLKLGKNSQIVVITEFGAAITDKRFSVLSMPAYALSVANILNGVSTSFTFGESEEIVARFTAPGAKILIVDDIPTNLKVVEGLLLPYRMGVDLCNSGMEAIDAIKAIDAAGADYDLIFMDHKMPEMDGIETTRRIREMPGKNMYYRHVPIIALTANVVSGTKEIFLRNGFNDVLSKPIDTVKLNAILEKYIPKEKQKSASKGSAGAVPVDAVPFDAVPAPAVSPAPAADSISSGEGLAIDRVDVKRGIFLSGGTIARYLETLAVFYNDGIKKTRDLRECLEKGDADLFTIHVHALKSAFANIGAGELAEQARVLEAAGENKDITALEPRTSEMLSALETLLEGIKTALEEYRKKDGHGNAPGAGDTGAQRKEFARLRSALKTLDAGVINSSIQTLEEMLPAGETGGAVNAISEKILLGDYHEAVTMIDTLLGDEDGSA